MTAPTAAAAVATAGATGAARATASGVSFVAQTATTAAAKVALRSLVSEAAKLISIRSLQDVAVTRDVSSMFAAHRHDADFPKVVHALLPVIINEHAENSALITAQWYDDLEPESRYRAKPFVDVPKAQLEKSIDWALYAPGDQPPIERMTGDAKRIVRNAGRGTVVRNAQLAGERWARLAQPDACSYCRALSVRGSGDPNHKYLYYSDKSAVYRKSDGEKYHTNCNCEPVPVRAGTLWTPPDYMADWRVEYNRAAKGTSGGKKYFQRITSKMRSDEPPAQKAEEETPNAVVP